MKKYSFLVEEILGRIVTVEAGDTGEALDIVERMYADEEIVLTAEDFSSHSIRLEEENEVEQNV
ncbi:MAG: DpnD/PcfM family protein [Clostridium sp.]